jgi:transcriptional regulator with XRE-family HTH domain
MTLNIGLSLMNLEQFGEELKQARFEKKISLLDISAETRINIKFLDAIERGQFQILPQTYVRAFLREYALMVNLDPEDVLKRYDSTRQDIPSKKPDEAITHSNLVPEGNYKGKLTDRFLSIPPLQRNIIFGAIIIAAVALIVILANLNNGGGANKTIAEVPFDHVIRESEAASIPPPSAAVDSVPVHIAVQKDSLQLEIITTDSVWISILIDDKKGEEYLFGANKKRNWKAKDRFVVTMGNAGGATFKLNGKDIGPLGKRGAVIRNTVINEANLKN